MHFQEPSHHYYGENFLFRQNICSVVKNLESGVEIKKLDSQGRIVLPLDWREAEIGETKEVFVIKRKGYLKLVPKRRIDLTECFDKADLSVDAIGSWSQFEKKFSKPEK
jgi:bifunctional DNA-binding transcriptional regulator/antitoxin component of YhaV-PrlF toxin-antitoxin module